MSTDFSNKQGTGIIHADGFQNGTHSIPKIVGAARKSYGPYDITEDRKVLSVVVHFDEFDGKIQLGDYIQVFCPIMSAEIFVYAASAPPMHVYVTYLPTPQQETYPLTIPKHDLILIAMRTEI